MQAVIGHRGASGHRPEHTAAAYRAAWRAGADSVEPDVLMSRDGVLVCRHDLDLTRTTDIAERPEFAHRRRTRHVEGRELRGWFVDDFDAEELRTLRARERWPGLRPRSARFDDRFAVLTLSELLDLRAAESQRAGRQLGVHVELKHVRHQTERGLDGVEALTELLRRRGLGSALAPISVMAFETVALRRLRAVLDVELVQLVDRDGPSARLLRRGGLRRVGEHADAVGLHQQLAVPRDAAGRAVLDGRTVERVRAAGLDVLVWTLRQENTHLPAQLRRGADPGAPGDAETFVDWLLGLGVDGLLTDFPETAVAVRQRRGGGLGLTG